MSEKVWQLKIEDKEHLVKYEVGLENGEVFLDGNKTNAKSSYSMGLVMEMSFKIDDKYAKVRRHDLLSQEWELVYDGKVIPPHSNRG
jgi:hypothetical protein